MKTALSVAGLNTCTGAGIQADTKFMTMNGVHAPGVQLHLEMHRPAGVTAIIQKPSLENSRRGCFVLCV